MERCGRITYSGATYTDGAMIRREQSDAKNSDDRRKMRRGGERDGLRHVGRNCATKRGVVSAQIITESTEAYR